MKELNQTYSNLEEVLVHIGNGVLVVHQRSSGSFLMLNNLLTAHIKDRTVSRKNALSIFTINELHPLYAKLNHTCGISNNSAVIIISNSQITQLLFSPITKNKLIKSLQTLDGSTSAI